MKVVQITTDSREHFKDYGNQTPYFGAAPEALLAGFSKVPEVEIHVISCVRSVVASPAKIAGNIHYHSLLVPKLGWMSTGYQGCIRSVRALISKIQPDLVHGQGTERDCAMDAVHSGFPNVVTIHGNMRELQRLGLQEHGIYGHLASCLETYSLRRTLGVFCNSGYTRDLVANRARMTWLVPNAIREAFITIRPARISEASSVPQIVCVGIITPRKRQLEILRAVGEVVADGNPLRIIFAGGLSEETHYGRSFGEEFRKAEAAGYASFAGFLGESQLISLLDRSHGFIHFPSEEAFGLVVAEAMARGLKFFGSDLGGIRDIAAGVPGAELFHSFDGLKKSLITWLKAGAPREPAAAGVVAARYAPEVVARRHLEIYREVLAS